jgi:hypothetical protein
MGHRRKTDFLLNPPITQAGMNYILQTIPVHAPLQWHRILSAVTLLFTCRLRLGVRHTNTDLLAFANNCHLLTGLPPDTFKKIRRDFCQGVVTALYVAVGEDEHEFKKGNPQRKLPEELMLILLGRLGVVLTVNQATQEMVFARAHGFPSVANLPLQPEPTPRPLTGSGSHPPTTPAAQAASVPHHSPPLAASPLPSSSTATLPTSQADGEEAAVAAAPEYIRQDIALEQDFANKLLAHGATCPHRFIAQRAKVHHHEGSFVDTALTCECGCTFKKPNSVVLHSNTIHAQADVNLRWCLAARVSKIGASRAHEFELKSGMSHAMSTGCIANNFDKIWEIATHPLCAKMLETNRETAAREARESDHYMGDTEITLTTGAVSRVASIQTISDGVYCTRSLGKCNYARASTAFWCVYSMRGLPLYIYRHQLSCAKCTAQFRQHSNHNHEGRCWRTSKGVTSITLAETIGATELGKEIKAGNIALCPYSFVGDGDAGAFAALRKELGVDIIKINCCSHLKRNTVGALYNSAKKLGVSGIKGFTNNRFVVCTHASCLRSY